MSQSSVTWLSIEKNAAAALGLVNEVHTDISTFNNGNGNVTQVISDLETIPDNSEYTGIKSASTVTSLINSINTATSSINLDPTLPSETIENNTTSETLTFLDADGNPLTTSSTHVSTISTKPVQIPTGSNLTTSTFSKLSFLQGNDATNLVNLIQAGTTSPFGSSPTITLKSGLVATISGNSDLISFSGPPSVFGITFAPSTPYSTQIEDGNGNWQTLTFTSPNGQASPLNCASSTTINTSIHIYIDSEFGTDNLSKMTFLSSSDANQLAGFLSDSVHDTAPGGSSVTLSNSGITVTSTYTGSPRLMYVTLSGTVSSFGLSTPLTSLINFLNNSPV